MLAACLLSCGSKGKEGPLPGGSASSSASASPSGSTAPAPTASAAAVPEEPQGEGVASFGPLAKDCAPAKAEIASYLQRGELTLAGRQGEIAASWLVQLKDRAQIAFAGFDAESKQLARARGIGTAREHAPTLFATGDQWTVVWFDPKGLAYARPVWEPQPGPDIDHLEAAKDVAPDALALTVAPDGSLVAVSPFGTSGADELSVFLFAPLDPSAPSVKAVGLTKNAEKPEKPAVAADDNGFVLAWVEPDGHIEATRIDKSGNDLGPSTAVAPPFPKEKRSAPLLVKRDGGFFLAWVDDGVVLARALSDDVSVKSPIFRVGKGEWIRLVSRGPDALIAFVAEAEGKPKQLVLARLTENGVAKTGLRVSESTEVLDKPALAMAGDRVALVWTEIMGPTVSTKRAWLRTLSEACIPR